MKVGDLVRHKNVKKWIGEVEEINRKEREALVFWLHLGEATWMPFRTLEATWK